MILDCRCPKCGGELVVEVRAYNAPAEVYNPYEAVNAILAEEAGCSGVTVAQIKGTSRSKDVYAVRKRVIRRAIAEAGISAVKLGRMLGGRDHTTIMHALKD